MVVAIGGAAGDGVASAGKTLALSMARQGLAVYSYNSYQSVIRGGHSYLRLRISANPQIASNLAACVRGLAHSSAPNSSPCRAAAFRYGSR